MRAGFAVLALLVLVGAKNDSSELDKALAGRVAGQPQNCIDTNSNDGPQIIDNRTLIYRSAGRVWRNTLPDECPSLRDDSILIVEVYGAQLCSDDRFRTVTRGLSIPSAYCRLGRFVPYTKPKVAKPQPAPR